MNKILYMRFFFVILFCFFLLSIKAQIISTVAGDGVGANSTTGSFGGDGGPALSAGLDNPHAVTFDASGNMFISDKYNNSVRKVDVNTGIITTIAGVDSAGYRGDGGPATSAKLYWPMGLRFDTAGNLYIADYGNNRIRNVTISTGIITSVAGTGVAGFAGDGGPAINAKLGNPIDVTFDSHGNMYIADMSNERIRKVDVSTGIITTIAGIGGGVNYGGDGGPATLASFSYIYAIAFDASDNLFIADWNNSRVRKITSSNGIISTVIGTNAAGFSGDGGPANLAQISHPTVFPLMPPAIYT